MISALYNIILSPITQIIEISYNLFSKLFSNIAVSLVGVSLTVTLLCLPLYIVAEKWQETERGIQGRMKGGIARIKRHFKGDEQYMILSAYYRENRYHPMMALRSSFGILIQIPFFLAAYHTLSALPDLQGKSFLFIEDLGLPDTAFRLGPVPVNVLPILMTAINCVSGYIYSKGHETREKLQIYGMALVFLVVLYNSPAGLVIYWTMNNVFSLVKNVFYKLKNPALTLYRIACAAAVFVALYVLFLYSGGAGMKKRVPAAIAALLVIPIPLYMRIAGWMVSVPLRPLKESARLRTALFLASAISLTLLSGLVLPSSLISTSVQEFSNVDGYGNPAAFLQSSLWMSFGLFGFWPACVFFLFKAKVQTILAFLSAFLLVCSLVNTFAFAGDYGSMDPSLIFIDGEKVGIKPALSAANAAAILLAFALVLAGIKFGLARILQSLCAVSAISMAVLSAVNVSKIGSEYARFQKTVSEGADGDGDFSAKIHLSRTEKNVMVFMLDRFESAYVPHILTDYPSLMKRLDGFTYYPNSISPDGHTLMGSPGIYGGYEYLPDAMNARKDATLRDKHNEALSLLPTILTGEAGFTATAADLGWANYSYISDMSFLKGKKDITALNLMGKYSVSFKRDMVKSADDLGSISHSLNRNLLWVSLFRESPVALRPVVYYKGTWWENGVRENSTAFSDWFSVLHYFSRITEVDSERPTLTLMANEATHSNEDISMYDLPVEGRHPSESKSLPKENGYPIQCVTLNEIANIVSFLKESDCYDNTRIILVSDHGIGRKAMGKERFDEPLIDDEFKKDSLNNLLMVKDFSSHGTISIDDSFMTVADVPSIALSGIVENPKNPFTGKPISTDGKKDGILVTTDNKLFMPYHSKSEYEFTVPEDSWYRVRDDIFRDENWTYAGKTERRRRK